MRAETLIFLIEYFTSIVYIVGGAILIQLGNFFLGLVFFAFAIFCGFGGIGKIADRIYKNKEWRNKKV